MLRIRLFKAAKRPEMCSAVMKGLRFVNTQQSCFEAWKRSYIRAVSPCYVVDLMILRNRVLRLRNVQIWVVLSWKLVVCWYSRILFSSCKTFRYGMRRSARSIFAESQEWHFQAAKCSYMSSTIIAEVRFAHAQVQHFHAAKRWNVGSSVQQWSWFADA